MKKLLSAFIALTVLALSLAGCNGGDAPKSSVPDIAKSIEPSATLINPIAMVEDDLIYTLTLTQENIEAFAGSYSNTTGASGTVLVIKAKSGKADAVKAELETYKTTNADFLSTYDDFAIAAQQAKEGRVVAKGDVVVLVIAGPHADYAAIDTAVENALQ